MNSVRECLPMSEARVSDLMLFQMGLEKTGAIADDIGRVALNAGITVGVGIGANLAAKGGAALVDALTFKRDLEKLIAHYPELKNADPKVLKAAYSSLRNLNPDFAKDPLVGGSLLQAILRNVPSDNPRGMPRFDLSTAQILNQARGQNRGGFAEELIRASAVEGGKANVAQHARAADAASQRQGEETRAADMARRALARLQRPPVGPADPRNPTDAERRDAYERSAAERIHQANYRP